MKKLDDEQGAIIQTYTATMLQVAELSELKEKLGLNASAVVRLAIDTLYAINKEEE